MSKAEMDLRRRISKERAKQPHRQGLKTRKRWSGRRKLQGSWGGDLVGHSNRREQLSNALVRSEAEARRMSQKVIHNHRNIKQG